MFAVVLLASAFAWLPMPGPRDPCKPCKYACSGCGAENPPAHCSQGICSELCASNDCMEKMCEKKFRDNCDGCMNDSNYKCMWNSNTGCAFAETANMNAAGWVWECPAKEERSIDERIDDIIEKLARRYSSVATDHEGHACAKHNRLARSHTYTRFDACVDCLGDDSCVYDEQSSSCQYGQSMSMDSNPVYELDNCPDNPCMPGSTCSECLADASAGCIFAEGECYNMKSPGLLSAVAAKKQLKFRASMCS